MTDLADKIYEATGLTLNAADVEAIGRLIGQARTEARLAWENKLEGIAQFLEDLVWGRSIKEHEQEAFLHAAQIVRKAKEKTND
jgi:hypothetical protein